MEDEKNPCDCKRGDHVCDGGWHWSITPKCRCGHCMSSYPCLYCNSDTLGVLDY